MHCWQFELISPILNHGSYQPFFSIIVPTYRRPRQLSACLQSLVHLKYPKNRYEVIIVDDGSEEPPEAAVAALQNRLDITLLTQPNSGPATARNTGALKSKGEFLVFTDDDCIPKDNWLQCLTARFAQSPSCAVGGRTINALTGNLYAVASQLLVDYIFSYYNRDSNNARFLTTSNLAVPADKFFAMGGFDTEFRRAAGEDREFCANWLHRGHRLIFANEVVVFHNHHLTFPDFLRQHFNYGCGAYRFRRKCSSYQEKRVGFEPLSFYLSLVPYPFSQSSIHHKLNLSIKLALSQAVNVVGFYWESLNRKLTKILCKCAHSEN
jgi:glycosyltransferase involved in cell wall biosynthesis